MGPSFAAALVFVFAFFSEILPVVSLKTRRKGETRCKAWEQTLRARRERSGDDGGEHRGVTPCFPRFRRRRFRSTSRRSSSSRHASRRCLVCSFFSPGYAIAASWRSAGGAPPICSAAWRSVFGSLQTASHCRC